MFICQINYRLKQAYKRNYLFASPHICLSCSSCAPHYIIVRSGIRIVDSKVTATYLQYIHYPLGKNFHILARPKMSRAKPNFSVLETEFQGV